MPASPRVGAGPVGAVGDGGCVGAVDDRCLGVAESVPVPSDVRGGAVWDDAVLVAMALLLDGGAEAVVGGAVFDGDVVGVADTLALPTALTLSGPHPLKPTAAKTPAATMRVVRGCFMVPPGAGR